MPQTIIHYNFIEIRKLITGYIFDKAYDLITSVYVNFEHLIENVAFLSSVMKLRSKKGAYLYVLLFFY